MRICHLCVAATLLLSAPTAFAHTEREELALARAADLVDEYKELIEFCGPCGDVAPGVPFRAEGVTELSEVDDEGLFVIVNGKELQLHQTYVRSEAGRFGNLAILVGLPAEGVSPSLRIEQTTASGELITPSLHIPHVAATLSPEPVVEPEIRVAPPQDPESTVIVINIERPGPGWMALLALALSGATTTGMFWLVFAARARRRRTPLPRAIDL